jgi:hypothetical protein
MYSKKHSDLEVSGQNLTDQFVSVATQVSTSFPEIDLRFSHEEGSDNFQMVAPSISEDVFEFPLGVCSTKELIHETIFAIKEIAQLYDA